MVEKRGIKIIGGLMIIFALLINPFFMKIFVENLINPIVNTNFNIFENNLIIFITLFFELFLILMGLIFVFRYNWIIKKKETIKNIVLFIVAFILFLIFLEFINFLIIINRDAYYVWPSNLNKTFYPDSNVIYGAYNSSHFTTNSLGYRGMELIKNKSEEYRILVIGGSTTECVFLDDSETWPYLLEKNLNKTFDGKKVIVMNVGKSGHDTRDHILQLTYLADEYNPDLVVMLIGVNDLIFTIRYGEDWKPLDSDYSRAFSYSPIYSLRESLSYKSFKVFWGFIMGEKPIDPTNYVQKREIRANAPEIDKMPNITRGLDYYELNINKLINISKEKNVPLLLMTQPSLWKKNISNTEENSFVDDWVVPEGHYSTPVMTEVMDQYNLRLLEVCSKNLDIFCLDLASNISKDLNNFFDEVHHTENGAKSISKQISQFIQQNIRDFNKSLYD